MYYIQKNSFSQKQPSAYFYMEFERKWYLFPSLNIFYAFELDVNVVNFVYYGKTRLVEILTFGTCRCRFHLHVECAYPNV